jgi:hypothetical protein
MRLLLLNPNMTLKMTEEMAGLATTMLNHGSTLVPVTATTGFPYISSRAEALIAGGIALDTIASHRNAVDAVVIAAFGDPGLLVPCCLDSDSRLSPSPATCGPGMNNLSLKLAYKTDLPAFAHPILISNRSARYKKNCSMYCAIWCNKP